MYCGKGVEQIDRVKRGVLDLKKKIDLFIIGYVNQRK